MATAQKEIPIGDEELDALMAQLEAETADAVDAPAAAPAPVATAADDDDLDALAAELNGDPDAELAALAAELEADSTPPAAPTKQDTLEADLAAIAATMKKPEPAPEPVEHLEGDAALQAVAETLEKERPTPRAVPTPVAAPTPAASSPRKELNHYIDMAEFRREISVSVTNLDNCMMEQASLRAYHGEQAAHADAQHSRLKLRHEVVEARLYDKHRRTLAADPTLKVTEKMVENAVKQDPEYVSSKNRVIEAETIAAVRRSCTDALKDRKDMLVQLGADRREEGKGQVRILAAEASHMDKRAQAAAAVGSLRSA